MARPSGKLPRTNRNESGSLGASLRAIVFDMDGTLVSSLPVIFHCENEISRKYIETPLALEEVIAKFGPPAHAIIRSMTASLSENLQNQAVIDYYECYRTHVARRALVFPGITQLLKRIKSSGRRLALVTGVERVMMEYTLNPFSLSEFFETRITADDVPNSKPDPEGINLALRRLRVNPQETMYVGDSPADMIAGKRAGVLTGAALWSPENRGDPTTEHPDHEFRSVQHLSEFLFPKKKPSEEPYFGSRWTKESH
jgi:pyrophosphatase PpaX